MNKPANPPAFPSRNDVPMPGGGSYRDDRTGMTLRDWFTGQAIGEAMRYAFTNTRMVNNIICLPEEHAAKIAASVADALLAQRERDGGE